MNNKKAFYITTTLPYVNADPHIGFALEIVMADVLARYWRDKLGQDNVFFNTGSDEHGQKILEAAQEVGREVREYVDYYAGTFERLKSALNLSYDAFIRTTDKNHVAAAQVMWRRCKERGDIYKKEFEGLYCVQCERFLTQKDLTQDKCTIHEVEPQLVKEENWFFRFSRYNRDLLDYLNDPKTIIPEWRRQEATTFVKEGLEDFSISRDKNRLSWGIPVPDDDSQVMYVWFDALTNYISTLGWPNEEGNFKKFWLDGHVLQVAGKDQVRFQSLMWQAMLMSAGIKNTDQVFYHGFINSGGQKMSKSLGNVISPYQLVEKYGTDATRYLLIKHVHPHEDTDITWTQLDEWYNAHLADGLGNLTSRVMNMAKEYLDSPVSVPSSFSRILKDDPLNGWETLLIQEIRPDRALDRVAVIAVKEVDKFINEREPFKKINSNPRQAKIDVTEAAQRLGEIARLLKIFMPETSEKILRAIQKNEKPENLFPRIEADS